MQCKTPCPLYPPKADITRATDGAPGPRGAVGSGPPLSSSDIVGKPKWFGFSPDGGDGSIRNYVASTGK